MGDDFTYNFNSKEFKRSRIIYILEAAFEYFIAMLVAGSYLATITKELGFSDSLTGVISSIISLGCMFQLFSVFMRKSRVKSTVITLSIINQLLFATLYIIPLSPVGAALKKIVFIVAIFTAYLIYNFAHPKKMNWLMSVVEDKKRGDFTANKEIFSLITGMLFTYGMSFVFDYFKAKGEIKTAFIISASVMLLLTVLHTLTMILAIEPITDGAKRKNLKIAFLSMIKNKAILKVAVLLILYNIATYCSTPFFGTYLIGELGLELNTVSVLVISGSVSRMLISKFWGRYADKKSFASMIEKCFFVLAAAFAFHTIAAPGNALITILLYHLCHGIAMGGINSALTNLVFDYAEPETRADSLALCQATAGLTGFLTTLAASPLITLIQSKGNTIFGITVYAQQILSAVSLVITIFAIFFVRHSFLKKEKSQNEQN